MASTDDASKSAWASKRKRGSEDSSGESQESRKTSRTRDGQCQHESCCHHGDNHHNHSHHNHHNHHHPDDCPHAHDHDTHDHHDHGHKHCAHRHANCQCHCHDKDASADDDQEAGPAPPPRAKHADASGDEASGPEDEGRFFGGGISAQQSQILDYVADMSDDEPEQQINAAWLRRAAAELDKQIAKNAELRARFANRPSRFIDSEAKLDNDLKKLSNLAENPSLYPACANIGCVANLVGLLTHENLDIATRAMQVIRELTDEDVDADEECLMALMDALIDADLLGLIVSNFERLDEDDERNHEGVNYALNILENLCSQATMATHVGKNKALLQWLLQRLQRTEHGVSQNKGYAAEVLAVIAQAAPVSRGYLVGQNGMDTLLQLVAPYRKTDPEKGSDAEEFLLSVFEVLINITDEPGGKDEFVKTEGVELCLIMAKHARTSRVPALRLLDHAASGPGGLDVCNRIISTGGLSCLFTFLRRANPRVLEHVLGIIVSMMRLLPEDSSEQVRLLTKFIEKNYEKTAMLVLLHRRYGARLADAEDRASPPDPRNHPDEEELKYTTLRLDNGLFTLQQIDMLIAMLLYQESGIGGKIRQLFSQRGEPIARLAAMLRERRSALDTLDDADSRDLGLTIDSLIDLVEDR